MMLYCVIALIIVVWNCSGF